EIYGTQLFIPPHALGTAPVSDWTAHGNAGYDSGAEVVNNSNTTGGTWDLSFTVLPKPSNVEIYGTQLFIPPHALGTAPVSDWTAHGNAGYDSG
ncbi:hypothetical protein, partial [Chryseobacterium sp. CH1]|uniref:hypothetical protein n=1 Tax=Chryseobacterium sp. CH1 TaxID=713551 RepID=UPI0010257B13